jgi:hypothetical protein
MGPEIWTASPKASILTLFPSIPLRVGRRRGASPQTATRAATLVLRNAPVSTVSAGHPTLVASVTSLVT